MPQPRVPVSGDSGEALANRLLRAEPGRRRREGAASGVKDGRASLAPARPALFVEKLGCSPAVPTVCHSEPFGGESQGKAVPRAGSGSTDGGRAQRCLRPPGRQRLWAPRRAGGGQAAQAEHGSRHGRWGWGGHRLWRPPRSPDHRGAPGRDRHTSPRRSRGLPPTGGSRSLGGRTPRPAQPRCALSTSRRPGGASGPGV